MSSYRILRLACFAYCLALGAVLLLTFSDPFDVSPEDMLGWTYLDPVPRVPSVIASIAMFATVVASLLMIFRQRWARWLHVIALVVCELAGLTFSPAITSPLGSLFCTVLIVSAGFIYGVVFSTDALPKCAKKPNQPLEPTRTSVTSPAVAGVAPAARVAHL